MHAQDYQQRFPPMPPIVASHRPPFPLPTFWIRLAGKTLGMATVSLQKMAAGGMWDHLGGGFHRYSVDEYWHVPHFEKMLYDNPQLVQVGGGGGRGGGGRGEMIQIGKG